MTTFPHSPPRACPFKPLLFLPKLCPQRKFGLLPPFLAALMDVQAFSKTNDQMIPRSQPLFLRLFPTSEDGLVTPRGNECQGRQGDAYRCPFPRLFPLFLIQPPIDCLCPSYPPNTERHPSLMPHPLVRPGRSPWLSLQSSMTKNYKDFIELSFAMGPNWSTPLSPF